MNNTTISIRCVIVKIVIKTNPSKKLLFLSIIYETKRVLECPGPAA